MQRQEAEEHLRVIRSLMEKATVYRAISAPTALVGGLASSVAGAALYFAWRPLPAGREEAIFTLWFWIGWSLVLAITGAANTLFLWRDAKRRGDRFISSGMKHALSAMLPPNICAAGFTSFAFHFDYPFALPPVWMLCYGLGLLATQNFAPRSIHWLGWAFLAAGLASLWALQILRIHREWGHGESHIPTAANLMMLVTFGLFHLIYAACTWPRKSATHGHE